MKKEAAHTFFGRGGPKVVSLLGVQQADKSAARTCFSEHFSCVSPVGDSQALPEGPRGSDGDRRWWETARAMQGCAQTG